MDLYPKPLSFLLSALRFLLSLSIIFKHFTHNHGTKETLAGQTL
jgi:hypothetical protein